MKSFETLELEVTYDIYRDKIESFLLGVAIYTPNEIIYLDLIRI